MAVPRKSSRAITVDGDRYRWLLRRIAHQDGFVEGLELRIVREESNRPAIVGFLDTSRRWPDAQADPPFVILPRHVAAIIRHARSAGWASRSMRADFRVEHLQRFLDPQQE
jgi:hypothetical protein